MDKAFRLALGTQDTGPRLIFSTFTHESTCTSIVPMTDLNDMLERLGLSQYLQAFLNEGFDTWDTLMDITESDLYEPLLLILAHLLTARPERNYMLNLGIEGCVLKALLCYGDVKCRI